VPEATVAPVELLRVEPVEALHPARETLSGGVEDEVVVRAHETKRVYAPDVTSGDTM